MKSNMESGRTMVEMLGVLFIMGVLTAGAAVLVSYGMKKQKMTDVETQVSMITDKVRDMYRGYDDFSGLDVSKVFGSGGLVGDVPRKNPFGGTYSVAVSPANPRMFEVLINNLSRSDCETLRARAWTDSAGYKASGGKYGGAEAVPSDCGSSANNTVKITFGE